MNLKHFKKAFNGYLKKNTTLYEKSYFSFMGITFCLYHYFDKKNNELYIFQSRVTPLQCWFSWYYVSAYIIGNYFVKKNIDTISQFINKKTKIFTMSECSECVFSNLLFYQYHYIFPNKKNIYFISLAPPIWFSSKKYMRQIKEMGINFLIFKIKTDRAITKEFDQDFMEHIITLDELYKPQPQNPSLRYRLSRMFFNNHDLLHHLHAMGRYFNTTKSD